VSPALSIARRTRVAAGRGDHLARRENQKDFQIRMKQYFDHYLKGEPAPKWMTEGVPAVRKGESPSVLPMPVARVPD
jgi:hypothetical protein